MPEPEFRFRREEVENIYFRSWLCEAFKNSQYPLPENLKLGRNNAIRLGFMEIACCFATVVFYMRRRSGLILLLFVMNFLATIGGFYAKVKLSYVGLVIHGMYTVAVIGGFYIYIFIDNALSPQDTKTLESGDQINSTGVLIITSIPLLGLFCMGIYSIVLAGRVEEELDEREKDQKELQNELDQGVRQ